MIKVILAIAQNTFRETIRDRILYLIVGFSVLVIAASLLAASVSLGQDVRVIQSFSLTAMTVFLLVITIFIGTQLVYREIERKTIYLVLSKPVSREVFYLGKFFGLCLTVLGVALVMGSVLIVLLKWKGAIFYPAVLSAVGFLVLEAWLITAVGLLFSTFTSPLSSAVYTLCLTLIGHSSTTIWTISQKSKPLLGVILEAVYYLSPNLEKFNLRNEVVYSLVPDNLQVLTVVGYFLGYSAVLLILGMSAIRRHEF